MRIFLFVVSIASLAVLVHSKIYTKCELAEELYMTHKLEKEEIGYHLCIARTFAQFNTKYNSEGRIGIYRITKEWWCNEQFAGGHCHIKCSSLVDDYITDDIKCVQEIIRRLGVATWGLNREECERDFIDMTECLRNIERDDLRSKKNQMDIPQSCPTLKNIGNTSIIETCGKPYQSRGVIIGGTTLSSSQRGSYPWVAALVYANNMYFCGGVVISRKNVLTAAHCMQPKGEIKQQIPKNIKILLGVFNLNDPFEIGRVTMAVEKIQMHPDWNPFTERYEGDVAVLNLESEVQFSRFIQPICIYPPNPHIMSIKEGIVVGYGISSPTAIQPEKIPKIITLPIHKNEDCYLHNKEFAGISSLNTFCVGTGTGSGVCSGDSGSGFYVKFGDVYYLRGIVSASFAAPGMLCNVNDYAVLTSVCNYYDWIVQDNSSAQQTATQRNIDQYPKQSYEVMNLNLLVDNNFNHITSDEDILIFSP